MPLLLRACITSMPQHNEEHTTTPPNKRVRSQAAQCSRTCRGNTLHFGEGTCRLLTLCINRRFTHIWTTTTQDTGQKGQPYQKAFSITLHRIITRHKIVELRPKSWAGKLCGIKGFSFGTKIGSFYHFYCWLSLLFLLNLTVGIAKTNTRKPLGRRRD
jgi:hypothetical protein